MILSADGRTLWTEETLPAQKWMRDMVGQTVRFKGKKGANTLVFQFSRWNGLPDFFSQTDHTPYAVAFVGWTIIIWSSEAGSSLEESVPVATKNSWTWREVHQ